MSDPLDQLLRDADSVRPSAAAEDLPARVRRRRIRHRRTTRIVQASAGAAIIVPACFLIPHLHRTGNIDVTVKPPPTASFERAEQTPRLNARLSNGSASDLASLDLAARLHERIANDLLAHQAARKRRPRALPAHDPTLAMLQQQRDRAALLLVYEADQCRQHNQPREAIATYQKAIDLFPQSHWAKVARETLKGAL